MFNLLYEPWLSVIYHNGVTAKISLIEALDNAHKLQIAYPNPMDRIAVLRFILVLCSWCELNTGEILQESIPPGWLPYLSKQNYLFELFGDERRFMQKGNLNRRRPITELFHEIPTGNNAWHFRHSRDYADGVCCNCVVNGLLRLPLFFVSGRPNLKSGINGSPPIYKVFWPKNLLESLKQNRLPAGDQGSPVWSEQYRYLSTDKVPLLAGMTVPARLLYLNDPVESDSACAICGDKPGKLVYSCFFETSGDLENNIWRDPFVIYRDGKAFKASNIISSGRLGSDMRYRGLLEELLISNTLSQKRSILLVGFATDKAKYVDIWEKTISINPNSINTETMDVLSSWDIAIKNTMKHSSLNRFKSIKKSLMSDLGPQTEAIFSRQLAHSLMDSGLTWEKLARANKLTTRVISRALIPGISSRATKERSSIRASILKAPKAKTDAEGDADEQQS
jgi:hypothetical protein